MSDESELEVIEQPSSYREIASEQLDGATPWPGIVLVPLLATASGLVGFGTGYGVVSGDPPILSPLAILCFIAYGTAGTHEGRSRDLCYSVGTTLIMLAVPATLGYAYGTVKTGLPTASEAALALVGLLMPLLAVTLLWKLDSSALIPFVGGEPEVSDR